MCYLRVLVTLGVRCLEPSLIAEELLLPSGSSRSLPLTSIRKTCWSWNRSFIWFITSFIYKVKLTSITTGNLWFYVHELHTRTSKKKSPSVIYISLFNAPAISFYLMKRYFCYSIVLSPPSIVRSKIFMYWSESILKLVKH